MGSVIQIGDAIKFAEIAWNLYNFGWAHENNAGESYRAFGEEVRTLCVGLERLETAVKNARASLAPTSPRQTTWLRVDEYSLAEIIGNYKSTIHECEELLRNNRRYDQTTGPLRNIRWNLSVMGQVDHLRSRIHMHNLRIQHVLAPFNMDLISSAHQDLASRVMGVDTVVRGIREDLDIVIPSLSPEAAAAIRERTTAQPRPQEIPQAVQRRLDDAFSRARDASTERTMSLQRLTDCFLVHFERSTGGTQNDMENHNRTPPTNRHLELLKCQLLMQKIKACPGLIQAPAISHWHSYVSFLQENLASELSGLDAELPPDVANSGDEIFMFHFPPEATARTQPAARGPLYDELLRVLLDMGPNADKWKEMRLLRKTASESQFRIVETWGYTDEIATTEPKIVDFNIRFSRLIPRYAFPVQQGEAPPPLVMILEENGISHSYTFAVKEDLWLFQAALTGYRVRYMESRVGVNFIRSGLDTVAEWATVQLWSPHHIHGTPETGHERQRFLSLDSRTFSLSETDRTSRANSITSRSSGAAPSSSSWSSISQDETRAVRLDSGPANTSHAVIRSPPRHPLLVFFTMDFSHPDAPASAMTSIKIDSYTAPTRDYCECYVDPGCTKTVIEQLVGRQAFKCQRLENRQDLLRLGQARDWNGLIRVTLKLPTADARHLFSGEYCRCPRRTVAEENKCMLERKHGGVLGVSSVSHSRLMSKWQDEKDQRISINSTGFVSFSVP